MKKSVFIGATAAAAISLIGFFAFEALATLTPAQPLAALPTSMSAANIQVQEQTPVMKTGAQSLTALKENSLMDHRASVFQITGQAKLLKKNSEKWRTLRKGMVIQEGDQIRTQRDAQVRLHYDDYFLNILQINENSLAEFQTIEPTQIYITNGEIFSILDGLPKGTSYQVVTPTAVGGVRGTRFVRSFNPITQQDKTLVLKGLVRVSFNDTSASTQPFDVKGNESIAIDGTTLSDFTRASPRALTNSQTSALNKDYQASREALAQLKGGEAELHKAAELWEEFQDNPAKAKALASELASAGISQKVNEDGVIVFGAVSGSSQIPASYAKEQTPESEESVQESGNVHLAVTPAGEVINLDTGIVKNANSISNISDPTLNSSIDVCKQNPQACASKK